jgi:hypothetical protein
MQTQKCSTSPMSPLPGAAYAAQPFMRDRILAEALRDHVARLLGQPVEKMDDTQWIGHILKRLHLLDEAGCKRSMDGVTYAVRPADVLDMMRRYDVGSVAGKG